MVDFDNQKILVDDPLYTKYDLSGNSAKLFIRSLQDGSVDAYCPRCERKSVFRILRPEPYQFSDAEINDSKFGLIVSHAICVRQGFGGKVNFDGCNFDFYALFHRQGSFIVKIGQYPSKANLDFGELDDAFKELSVAQRNELGSAIGLFSHGVGVGSFVYLRRIFEKLIKDAYDEAIQENTIDQDEYSKSRMVEKIKLLKDYLPSRLVKSSSLYGVLSNSTGRSPLPRCHPKGCHSIRVQPNAYEFHEFIALHVIQKKLRVAMT